MSEIKVQCIDQAISFLNTPVISSGNVNYDTISFDFCSRWDGYVKTAIFYRNKDEVYYQLLENDRCIIPNEVLGEKGVIYIGVFGTQGDKTITSQVLTYRIQEGAVTEDLKPADPTPDIYAQLVGRFADFANELTDQQAKLDEFEARFNGSAGDAEKLGGQLPSYYASAESVANLKTNISNGTTPAGDSNKLGGKGASEYALVSSLSDLTPNRAHLSSEGWYRVAEISNTTIGYFSCILSLTQVYSSSNPQTTQLSIVRSSGDNGVVSITQLNGIMRSPSSVSKVRVVPDSDGKSAYIEIYYSKNTSNYVSVQITNILTDNLYGKYSNVAFTAGSIPSGYTATEFTLSSKPFKGDLEGTATGNLPLTGGTVGANGFTPIVINRTDQYANQVALPFSLMGATLASIGAKTDGELYAYDSSNNAKGKLLHDGNVGNYALLKTGGNVYGNVNAVADDTTARQMNVMNSLRRVYQEVSSNGWWGVYDGTNGKTLITSSADGVTNTFNGTASEASYVKASNGNELNPKGLTGQRLFSFNYRNGDTNSADTTLLESYVFGDKSGTTNNAIFLEMNQGRGQRELLHTGNSAKVVVSETPLTAEGAVRVW